MPSIRSSLSSVFTGLDSDLEVHKDLIGLYTDADISDATIVKVIKGCIGQDELRIECRGQCYDGARNMSGPRRGGRKAVVR